MNNRCKTALTAGISAIAMFAAEGASAQAVSPSTGSTTASAAQPTMDADTAAEIVVTGTHIARPGLQSAMPIAVISTDEAKKYGRNTVYDALLLNPAIGPGVGEMNSGGQEYDQGVSNINLRNLGANRSLVLVDGERWVSSGARTSAVDLNTIPSAAIDRIEVVTGGAAAIYGADAVSGAVNIVMKKNVTGVHISATNGISNQGDGRQTQASLLTGFKFDGGRGHFVFGADYTDTTPIDILDRFPNRVSYYPNPASKGPNDGIPDNLLNTDTRQIHRSSVPTFCLPLGANCQQWYQLINNVVTAVPQSAYKVIIAGPTGTQQGGPANDSSAFENDVLRAKSSRATAYANVTYELTPAITWSATGSFAHTYTRATPEWPAIRSDSRATNWWGGTTGEIATLTNPFLPDSLRQFMVANNLTAIPLGRTYLNLPRAYEYDKRNQLTASTDIGGVLTGALKWDAFARYGQVVDHITTTNMVGKNDWLAGRNSTVDATGNIVCADPVARANGCVPINFFQTAPFSQVVLNYIEHNRYEWNKNSLFNTGASVSGSIFSLPYGDVNIAAGVEWRRETLHTRDDPDTAKLADIVYSGGLDYALHPALDASRDTTELYGEMVVPLLKDLPFAKLLQIEGAYRFSHYTDNPNTNTWKVGGTWQPVSGLTLRGVYSRSVRVPNFGELFSPQAKATFGNINDPCQANFINQNVNRAANCAAVMPGVTLPLPTPNNNQPVVFSGGNSDLTPERSTSYTLGAVFQPQFLRGLDMTVDYWNIKIDNVITALPYTTILNSCVDSTGGPTQAYCSLITRDGVGNVVSVRAQYANLAAQKARGIDVAINYRTRLGAGQFQANLSGTYLLNQEIIAQVGKAGIDYAGEWDFPRFKATLATEYSIGRFTLGVNTRFLSRAIYNVTQASEETYQYPHIPAYVYNDLTLTFRPTEKYSLSLGVKNVSNVGVPLELHNDFITPHQGAGSFGADGPAVYDALGRYFFVRIGVNF